MSPREIARMITHDPNVINEGAGWQRTKQLIADELELGDSMYTVKFTVGMSFYPGERMVMYYPDGSGYSGSPPSVEVDILKIDSIEDSNGDPASEELTEQIKEALYKKVTDEDIMQEFDEPEDDDADYRMELMRDRRTGY